jgi:nucleotide-binding universal stress UspA family protein
VRWRRARAGADQITPPAGRILFPFVGDALSNTTLDAALRLARAEHAELVPACVVTVPLHMTLDATPEQSAHALSLLDLIEQRAARLKVPVDSRIEIARSPRHALHQLVEREQFDRLVVPAATHSSEGFSAEDIAWLLEHAPGEIVVLRSGEATRPEADSPHPDP